MISVSSNTLLSLIVNLSKTSFALAGSYLTIYPDPLGFLLTEIIFPYRVSESSLSNNGFLILNDVSGANSTLSS